ncbi:aspartyl protease family protein [Bacteroides acidifaciens]|uniref:aspartyl protease family protein n=1 Tax=Bacteroides acidifaciens TaxID=85831 RepID=UPI00242BA9F2|nr:aspartyl protease family protein [Bacteroides acidifaciens]
MQHYYLILTLLILLVSCSPKQETKYYFKEQEEEGWLIPVRIGEESYDFLFDTGSSSSCIEQKIALKLKLQTIDSLLVYREKYKEITYHDLTEKITFSIADTPMNLSFYISDRNIIGTDIINKYHWSFNRSDTTFQLQEKNIPIEKRVSDIVYKKKYHFNDTKVRVPVVDLLINDTISIPLLFDSGNAQIHTYDIDGEPIATLFPVIDLTYYENMPDNGFFQYLFKTYGQDAVLHFAKPRFFFWLEPIIIDNLPPSCFYMSTDIDSIYKTTQTHRYIGTLTWHFIRQFRTFSIDPEKQEFTFIVSPEDSSIIKKSSIEEIATLKKKRKIKFVD